MSYVDPKLADKFESLPIELKNTILEKNVKLYTMQDLIHCLEEIAEDE
ncbi:hypothetical protein EDD70_1697 [Hydrogenoanaerobacterium saccharovorans]|uniref:Uncharacterized protein n=1 Tax=Hydrogenoanaerobacterium saccharovorans TaxID=474960 RepID=A0A1H7Z1P4_9FIRM|nr:molecular chaperone GroEL [Hydrogenoanaerobacterium saccharovorans]RPF48864.1 hypothetical protein EDD70_1697 [Hydrogenoanaerobacterium saccharovorans]SEM52502.1 hypothetical protein SAMN05216180_0399 [Hydrogenoanaerobacterium saccharovorans]